MKKALTFALAVCWSALALFQSTLGQEKASRAPVSIEAETGSREQDGFNGPVRRVRVETAKVVLKDGKWVEGTRQLLGIATYDLTGKKVDSAAYPVATNTLPGKEQYLYDDKGNIREMTLVDKDGTTLSKETYTYEFDQLGNWTKMSSSVAVYENGKISFEPIGTTYRTISYYYNQAIEKLNARAPKPNRVLAPRTSSTLVSNSNASPTAPPQTSTNTEQVNTLVQPLLEASNAHAKKELTSAPASVVPVKNNTSKPDSSIALSADGGKTADEAPATSVVQHVAEDVLRNAAIEMPKPEYSAAALASRASGIVKVQILIDEDGNVTNAQATSGHPLLGAAAEAAARKARFSMARVSSGSTKVYGIVSYDFESPAPASETASVPSPTSDSNSTNPVDSKPDVRPVAENAGFVESKPKALANYSESSKAFFDKGVAFQASGQFAEAAEAFNQAIRANPNDATAYARLGMAYSALEKHKDALVVYKMARQADQSALGASAYYMWGHSYLALRKNSDALSAFKQALYITRAEAIQLEGNETPRFPTLEQLHYGLGIAYLNTKRFAESIDELKEVVRLNPKNGEAYFSLAVAYLSNGNRREAEKHHRNLSLLNPALAEKLTTALTIEMPPGCRNIVCR
jgi:TonB family protein